MKTTAAVAVASLLLVNATLAGEPDTSVIARVTRLQPEVKNGVAKVSVPAPTCPSSSTG